MTFSNIEEDGRLVGEFLFLDAKGGSVCLIVNIRQVSVCWALTYTTEFIVYRSVTQAHPSFVRSEIWDRNTAKMRANSRDAHKGRVAGIRDLELRLCIEFRCLW